MKLTSEFELDAPADHAWELLMDVPRVIPCMPGAEFVEALGDERWKAVVRVKLGPMAMVFDVDVERDRVDAAGRSVRLLARANEKKGRGRARAAIRSSLGSAGAGRSRVEVETDLELSGRIAQFGRGAVKDVSEELVARFTENLAEVVGGDSAAAGEPAHGARLLPIVLGAMRRGLRRLRARLAGVRA